MEKGGIDEASTGFEGDEPINGRFHVQSSVKL